MAKYKKDSSRIPVQFIDPETEEVLFEISNRNPTNINEIFSDYIATSLINQELSEDQQPDSILLLIPVQFYRTE